MPEFLSLSTAEQPNDDVWRLSRGLHPLSPATTIEMIRNNQSVGWARSVIGSAKCYQDQRWDFLWETDYCFSNMVSRSSDFDGRVQWSLGHLEERRSVRCSITSRRR
jgi:hypothetical protein